MPVDLDFRRHLVMLGPTMGGAEQVVCIVGAGPAGTSAAQTLAAADLGVEIFDEQARPGGNIHRRQFDAPASPLETLAAARPGVKLHLGRAVLGVGSDLTVESETDEGIERRLWGWSRGNI